MNTELNKIFNNLKNTQHVDLSAYCQNLIERQIQVRMKKLNINNLADYWELLKKDHNEYDNLVEGSIINVSSFFRNPIVFEIIYQSILPDLIENKKKYKTKEIRIWSAGCSNGEEAFSIAILLDKYLKTYSDKWIINIFATDIDKKSIENSKKGIFKKESFETTQFGILEKYFTKHDSDSYKIKPNILQMVKFSFHDLLSTETFAPPESIFGSFDIIFCRNVLIYFTGKNQKRVLSQITDSLNKDGYLILGEAESLPKEIESNFIKIDSLNKIYKKI